MDGFGPFFVCSNVTFSLVFEAMSYICAWSTSICNAAIIKQVLSCVHPFIQLTCRNLSAGRSPCSCWVYVSSIARPMSIWSLIANIHHLQAVLTMNLQAGSSFYAVVLVYMYMLNTIYACMHVTSEVQLVKDGPRSPRSACGTFLFYPF